MSSHAGKIVKKDKNSWAAPKARGNAKKPGFPKVEHIRINFSHISIMFRAILPLALVQVHSQQKDVKQVAKEVVEL